MQDKQCRATLDYEGLLVQLLNYIFKKMNYYFLQTFKNNFLSCCVLFNTMILKSIHKIKVLAATLKNFLAKHANLFLSNHSYEGKNNTCSLNAVYDLCFPAFISY